MPKEIRTPKKYRAMSSFAFKLCMAGLVIFIACAYVYFKGNPITKFKIDKHADNYIEEKYPEIAQQVEKLQGALYTSFGYYEIQGLKTTPHLEDGWLVSYHNPDDQRMLFRLRYDKEGNLLYDGYKEHYLKGGRIYSTLSDNYRDLVTRAKTDEYDNGIGKTSVFLHDVIMEEIDAEAWLENHSDDGTNEMAYNGPVLDITKEYTIEELANQYGTIAFIFREDEAGDIEALYNRCIQVRNFIEKYNLPFAKIDVSTKMFQGAYGITKEELYSDNLKQVIQDKYQDIYNE